MIFVSQDYRRKGPCLDSGVNVVTSKHCFCLFCTIWNTETLKKNKTKTDVSKAVSTEYRSFPKQGHPKAHKTLTTTKKKVSSFKTVWNAVREWEATKLFYFFVKLVCIELMCVYKEHVPAHFLHTHWLYCSVSRVNSRGLSSPVKVAWVLWPRGKSGMRWGF